MPAVERLRCRRAALDIQLLFLYACFIFSRGGSASGSGIVARERSGACGRGEPPLRAREAGPTQDGSRARRKTSMRAIRRGPPAPHYDGALAGPA